MLTWWSSVGARDTHMLRFHELQHNPVSVACRDESGATYEVVAMRLRGGMVKMTCQCQHYSQEGWCNHCLAVFCDRDVFQDDKHREAFDRLVGATYLQEAAEKLIKALDTFAVAYKQMKSVRPSQVNRGQLKKFAGQAYHAGSSADDLVVALEGFMNEVAARHAPEPRPEPARPSLSKDKLGVLEVVRRALAKGME